MPASERALELALTAAQAAADKKADDIVILDVADQLVITDAFLLASAPNERQVLAIVDAIEERLLGLPEKAKPVRREGERAGRWVLLDYVDIVVHVQHSEEREFYSLDRLWKDCPRVPFVDRDCSADARRRMTRHDPADHLAARAHRVERRPAGSRARLDVDLDDVGVAQAAEAAPRLAAHQPDRDRLQRPAPGGPHRRGRSPP